MERQHVAADVVFIDPPYRMQDAYTKTLRALADSSLVWAMSVVIAEHEKKFDPGEEFGPLRRFRHLAQGSSRAELLSYGKRGGSASVRIVSNHRGPGGHRGVGANLCVLVVNSYMISSSLRRTMGCCISSRSFFTMFSP